jgi:hypothetical protein
MKHLVLNAVLAAVIVFAGFRCLIGVRHWGFTPQPWKQIDIACISVGAIAEIILTLAAGLPYKPPIRLHASGKASHGTAA